MASSSVSQEDNNTTANERGATWSKKIKMRLPRTNTTGPAASGAAACKSTHHSQHPQHNVCSQEDASSNGVAVATARPHSFSQHIGQQAPLGTGGESPVLNRTRSKTEREKPVRAGSASSANSKLRVQREKRRTKRREAYMPSTEGTSTGEEDSNSNSNSNELIGSENSGVSNSLSSSVRNGDEMVLKAPPQAHCHLNRKVSSSCRASKSPSDLDADDEDNQDCDSASMVSTSENAIASQQMAYHDEHDGDNASFRAQFQEIREAGMQQLAAAAAENDSSGLVSESSSCNDDIAKMLEKEKRTKCILMQDIEHKEKKLSEMENVIDELNKRLRETEMENQKLKNENQSLQRTLAKTKSSK